MIAVEVLDEVAPLAPEWERLAQRLGAEPFLGPDWIAAHWKAFGTGRLTIIAVRRDGQLGTVLALMRRGGTARSITNPQTPLYGVTTEDHELTRHALDALGDLGVSRLALSYVDRHGPLAAAVREQASADGWLLVERLMLRSPYIVLSGTVDDFQARLGKTFRANIRRRSRRLGEQGTVEFDVRDGSEDLDRLLDEGWELEAAGWKGRIGTAVAAQPSRRRFYAEIARRAAARDRLRLFFLRLDRAPMSFMFGLEQGGVLYLLKGGFDPTHARASPGQLLLARVLEWAYGTGLERIELLGGDEPHKLAWTSTVHERLSMQSFARSPARSVQWAAHAHGRPLVVRIGLDRAARPVRDRARMVSQAMRWIRVPPTPRRSRFGGASGEVNRRLQER